jgi:probable phosphoglycerate mutase
MSETIALFAGPFYFLRHGETEANVAGLITGTLDVDLTAQGRAQALGAAQTLAREPITAVYSSPLRRASDTAQPIAKALRLPVKVIDELAERRRGELEGQPRVMLSDQALGAEDFDHFSARVLEGLSQVDSVMPLIVAHQGVFRVLCETLQIVHVGGPIPNARPLRFVPVSKGWKIEALPSVFNASVIP